MVEIAYTASDGKEFKDRQEAFHYEYDMQVKELNHIMSDYHSFRFNNHRWDCAKYLRLKKMSVEEFIEEEDYKASRSHARKRLWELRKKYKENVASGEIRIRAYKDMIKSQNEEVRKTYKAMTSRKSECM